jgi:hypothetical protein
VKGSILTFSAPWSRCVTERGLFSIQQTTAALKSAAPYDDAEKFSAVHGGTARPASIPVKSSATEPLAGLVERITFRNEENGFWCCGRRFVASGVWSPWLVT